MIPASTENESSTCPRCKNSYHISHIDAVGLFPCHIFEGCSGIPTEDDSPSALQLQLILPKSESQKTETNKLTENQHFPIYIRYCRDGYLDDGSSAWAVWTSTMPKVGVKELNERVKKAEHVLFQLLTRLSIPLVKCVQRTVTKHTVSHYTPDKEIRLSSL